MRAKLFGVNPTQYNAYRKRASEIATLALMPLRKLLFVHNTMATEEDIKIVLQFFKEPWFCLCPNSNLYIEKMVPNIKMLEKQTLNITIGTDSLASNTKLSILEELKTIALHFPEIPTTTLLKWGTENGAKFMGIDSNFGTLKVGSTPGINQLVCDSFDLKNVSKVIKIA
jgi:cytosine/adenosine deaminase-related metal-dependent hydrolase